MDEVSGAEPAGLSFARHEAGHGVLLWHHQWPFREMVLTPDDPMHGGLVKFDWPDPCDRERTMAAMEVFAAGPCAGKHAYYSLHSHDWLRNRFIDAVADGSADHPHVHVEVDIVEFMRLGLRLDAIAPVQYGPDGWLRIWQEAERKITGELWPVVEKVAAALLATGSLPYSRFTAIAEPVTKAAR